MLHSRFKSDEPSHARERRWRADIEINVNRRRPLNRVRSSERRSQSWNPFGAPRPMIWASQPYYLTNTWLLAMTTAFVVPPLVAYLHRHRWRFSIRGLLMLTAAICIGFGCAAWELWSLRWVPTDPQPFFVHPGEWWYPIPALILSSLVTWAMTRPTDIRDG
jgi:hypothetical protein